MKEVCIGRNEAYFERWYEWRDDTGKPRKECEGWKAIKVDEARDGVMVYKSNSDRNSRDGQRPSLKDGEESKRGDTREEYSINSGSRSKGV